jgi:hypothetical protein
MFNIFFTKIMPVMRNVKIQVYGTARQNTDDKIV